MQNTEPFDDMAADMAAEIEAIMASSAGRPPRAEGVTQLTHGTEPKILSREEREWAFFDACEVASETDPAGRLATIEGLLHGLMLRHADDDATTSAVMAILHLHLPVLLAERKQ